MWYDKKERYDRIFYLNCQQKQVLRFGKTCCASPHHCLLVVDSNKSQDKVSIIRKCSKLQITSQSMAQQGIDTKHRNPCVSMHSFKVKHPSFIYAAK